jgi:DNA-binding transcriptional LysR family regulator
MTMNLRDLQYFAEVAEHKHLGRAAESLEMSQPALSMSLRRLETFLHTKLVKRTPKGVELTPAGEAVYAHARRLHLSVDDIAREVSDIDQGFVGQLRIGANSRFGAHIVPPACAVLLREAPRLQLKIALLEANRGVPALSRGELDVYLTANILREHHDLIQEQIYDDEWVIVAASHHRLARKKNLTFADIKHERWVLGLYGAAQDDLIHLFASKGLPAPIIAAEGNSMQVRRELVAVTDLLTFGPRQFLVGDAARAAVVALDVKGLTSRRSVSVCYRKNAYLPPVARRFVEILKKTALNMAGKNRK